MTLEVAPNTWLFSCERKEREEEHEIRRRCNSLDDNIEKSTTINTKGHSKKPNGDFLYWRTSTVRRVQTIFYQEP